MTSSVAVPGDPDLVLRRQHQQQWQPIAVGNGYYRFVARDSGLCLEVPGGSTANGVRLWQNTCNGSTARAFRLVQRS